MWRPGGGRSELTWRRIRVLVDHLPPESATKTAIRDSLPVDQLNAPSDREGWGSWSHTDHLLAAIADRVSDLAWLIAAANSEKGRAPHRPDPIPRPGVGPKPGDRATADARRMSVAYLRASAAAQGAEPTKEQIEAQLRLMDD